MSASARANAPIETLFPEADLCALARIVDRDVVELRQELSRRPWHLHDLLSEPETAEAVLGAGDGPVVFASPLLYFAVLVHRVVARAVVVKFWPPAAAPVRYPPHMRWLSLFFLLAGAS